MNIFKNSVLPVILATIWISSSEFIRNEIIAKTYWINHYEKLGILFPSEPINGAIWGIWSLFLAIVIFIILKRFTFTQTVLLSWFTGFVMMWVVIGNLGVLPYGLLIFAVPLSLLEVFLAALIIKKLQGKKETGKINIQ